MNKSTNENLRSMDRYEILRELGRGGTSIVYLVSERETRNTYAMKVHLKNGSGEAPQGAQQEADQLRKEASVLRALNNRLPASETGPPGIPAYFGEVCDEAGAFTGFLMEYVEGSSLNKFLEEGKKYTVSEAAEAGLQLCAVMKRLHHMEPPMIYRDLKPANILVKQINDRDKPVDIKDKPVDIKDKPVDIKDKPVDIKDKPANTLTRRYGIQYVVVDYGAVRNYKNEAGKDTHHLGTEGYAAPEQYGGWEQSDERTDIYGIGAVLHHMLTGRPPLETGLRPLEEVMEIPPGDCLPRQYSEMSKILLRCCGVAPSTRFHSCTELEKALRGVIRSCDRPKGGLEDSSKGILEDRPKGILEDRPKGILEDRSKGRSKATGIPADRIWKKVRLLCCTAAAFMACSGMLAVSSAGAGKAEYRFRIQEAERTENLNEKAEKYHQAIRTRPEDAEAYLAFLRDLVRDCVITNEEREALESVAYADGSLDRMREKNPEEYAAFELELGKALFCCYEGGTEAARIAFGNVLQTAGLWYSGRECAEAMEVILGEDWTERRLKAWKTLERVSVREAGNSGNGTFAASVCRSAVTEIALYEDRYEAAGATPEMLKEVTETAVEFMDEAEKGRFIVPDRLCEELRAAVEPAAERER